MANAHYLAILRQGVGHWNRWRQEDSHTMTPNFSGVDMSGLDLRGAECADLSEADLSTATLSYATVVDADLSGANLSSADLTEANLSGANLEDANLKGANLRGADLSGANLIQANLKEAIIASADLRNAILIEADLSRAKLIDANLPNADFSEAKLTQADLRRANLTHANFAAANLSRANLTAATLTGGDLRRANLIEANLGGVDLKEVNLSGSDLTGADLEAAEFYQTVLGNVNLGSTRGLHSCKHWGPSIIDYNTLIKSGTLPVVFLRGCGLPDNFIDYLPSLLHQPIQFYSCFISYSVKDQDFANRLYADLQAAGVRCWFAHHDMQSGKKVHEQIDAAIRVHERLLLILSPSSMASEWVKTEIAKARKRELKEHRQVLFPVRVVDFESIRDWECFDSDTGKDSAREIREYFIPDFSRWKQHDSYQHAFERLLRDLKAETQKA
jgi:uncharacterized protein YjbI with pentapeptide repeats